MLLSLFLLSLLTLISPAQSQAASCSIAAIAASDGHTVGLKEDGTVVAVGWNAYGQLNVSSWTNVKAVAAGSWHTVGLKEDGTVVAVGSNAYYGQLDVSSWTNIKAVAASYYQSVGLREDGTVVAVGDNSYGKLNVSSWTNIKAVAAGYYNHTVGLKEDGTVVAVGDNSYGQLNVSSWTNIKAVAAGDYHTVGLKEDGTVVAVGNGGLGQLNVSSWTNIKAVAAGGAHTVGLKEDGTVVAVGWNRFGQLNVSSWTNISAIAASPHHNVGLKEDGTVMAVGWNYFGQLDVSAWTDVMLVCGADATPPVTTVALSGISGSNGWYLSDVAVILTASDADSGVKEIHYQLNGSDEITVAGSTASFSLTAEGSHTVTYYAVDNAGNKEAANSLSINIDKTPPSIASLTTNPSILWPPNHKMVDVTISGSANDTGSGIASVEISVTDEMGVYNMTGLTFGSAIQLEAWRDGTDKDGRTYTITAVVTDKAGNRSAETTTVVVPHDMR